MSFDFSEDPLTDCKKFVLAIRRGKFDQALIKLSANGFVELFKKQFSFAHNGGDPIYYTTTGELEEVASNRIEKITKSR